MWTVVILLLGLSVLGMFQIPVFAYLAGASESLGALVTALFQSVFGVAGQTLYMGAEGAKQVVRSTEDVLDNVQSAATVSSGTPIHASVVRAPGSDVYDRALQSDMRASEPSYQALEAPSSVHLTGKAGWCLVGSEGGYRSCAEVGKDDVCVSGQVFPTVETCQHPHLLRP